MKFEQGLNQSPQMENEKDYEGEGGLSKMRRVFNKTTTKALLIGSVMLNMAAAKMAEAKNNNGFELQSGQKTEHLSGSSDNDGDEFEQYKQQVEDEFNSFKEGAEDDFKKFQKEAETEFESFKKSSKISGSSNSEDAFNELDKRVNQSEEEIKELQGELGELLDRLDESNSQDDKDLSKTLRILTKIKITDKDKLEWTIGKVKSILEPDDNQGDSGQKTIKNVEKGGESETSIDVQSVILEIRENQQKTAEDLKTLHENSKDKGRTLMTGTGVYLKKLNLSGGLVQKIGYRSGDSDLETPMFSINESSDASVLYSDDGFDGTVNRIVKNNTGKNPSAESSFNMLKLAGSMKELGKEAEITAGLMPEDVSVFQVNYEGEDITVEKVDFETGKYSKITGAEAVKMAEKFQNEYSGNIKKAVERTN